MDETIDLPGEVWVSQKNGAGIWLQCQVVSKRPDNKRLVRVSEGSLAGSELVAAMGDVRWRREAK